MVNFPRIFHLDSNWSLCDDGYYHDMPFPASVNEHVWYKINTTFCALNYIYSRKKAINVESKCIIKLSSFPGYFWIWVNIIENLHCHLLIYHSRRKYFTSLHVTSLIIQWKKKTKMKIDIIISIFIYLIQSSNNRIFLEYLINGTFKLNIRRNSYNYHIVKLW